MPEGERNTEEAAIAENQSPNNDETGRGSKIIAELMYSFASFHAIVAPVSITMILSALAVVYINTEETREQGEAAFAQTYEVLELEEGDTSQNFAASVANTLIIVSAICAMTFVVVLLYKYRCMKIFSIYMVSVTGMLLSYFTSNMFIVAIEKYNMKIDKLSYAYIIWNYSIVGVLAIFYNKGIPRWVSQGYLIASSVVLAWQLSYFNEWTAWTLLVVLALYDLFAVLTPCGPLKALANLMSQPGAQELPGLLYEALLPANVQRPNRRGREQQQEAATNDSAHNESGQTDRASQVSNGQERLPSDEEDETSMLQLNALPDVSVSIEQSQTCHESLPTASRADGDEEMEATNDDEEMDISSPWQESATERTTSRGSIEMTVQQEERATPNNEGGNSSNDTESVRTGKVPLAIAKMYKLQVVDDGGVLRKRGQRGDLWQRSYSAEEVRTLEWTPKQLQTEVNAVFPARGGRIEKADDQSFQEGTKWIVYSRAGDLLRTFVVNRKGQVMQVVHRERSDDDTPEDNSIKLGLVSDY
jgi:hypothetical protein